MQENNSIIWAELIMCRPSSKWNIASLPDAQSVRRKHSTENIEDKSATNMKQVFAIQLAN